MEKNKFNITGQFLIPFASGILGTSIVIGTCFGIPTIKNFILTTNSSSNKTSLESNLSTSTDNSVNTL